MEKILNVNRKQYVMSSDRELTLEEERSVIEQLRCGKREIIMSPATCPSSLNVGATKTVTASASGGTSPYTYSWSIIRPDGVTDSKTGSSFTYTFSQVGTYTITLTVTDAANKTCTDSCSISVVVGPPSCSFTVT